MGVTAEKIALERLMQVLFSCLPSGSSSIELNISMLSSLNAAAVRVYQEDGSYFSVRNIREIVEETKILRHSMYRERSGSWFSARISVDSNGALDANFNFDEEPPWKFPISPTMYADDLTMFPRDADHRPQWLNDKIAETEFASEPFASDT